MVWCNVINIFVFMVSCNVVNIFVIKYLLYFIL